MSRDTSEKDVGLPLSTTQSTTRLLYGRGAAPTKRLDDPRLHLERLLVEREERDAIDLEHLDGEHDELVEHPVERELADEQLARPDEEEQLVLVALGPRPTTGCGHLRDALAEHRRVERDGDGSVCAPPECFRLAHRRALEEERDVAAAEASRPRRARRSGTRLPLKIDAVLALEVGDADLRAVVVELRVLARQALVHADDLVVLRPADGRGAGGEDEGLLLGEPWIHHEREHDGHITTVDLGPGIGTGWRICGESRVLRGGRAQPARDVALENLEIQGPPGLTPPHLPGKTARNTLPRRSPLPMSMGRPRFDPRQPQRQFQIRVNHRIRVPEVRVIDANGEMLGVLSTHEALRRAQEQGLDLVEVNPKAEPPVCKILDFGKYKYEEKKKAGEAKRKQTVVEIKEIKLRPKTDDHDIAFKTNAARRFLEAGHKVKFTVRFRGREITHPEKAQEQITVIIQGIEDIANVETRVAMEARAMSRARRAEAGDHAEGRAGEGAAREGASAGREGRPRCARGARVARGSSGRR